MVTRRDPRVRMSDAYRMQKRVLRAPQHRFNLRTRPFQLQPFMIAPVLPGETMQNLLLQARVVTDPLDPSSKLVGWWSEHFFFYVKHRDLDETDRALLVQMMLEPNVDVSALKDVDGEVWSYCFPGGIDWVKKCTARITEEFFRDEGESWDDHVLDGVPMVQIYGKGHNDWSESVTLDADKRTDMNVKIDLDGDGNGYVDEALLAMQQWQALRDSGLQTMDYEDFVRTYGGDTRQDEESPVLHRPELLRYSRAWSYPTNIVEPTTGVPATAVAWSIAERADKRRRFNEPGFIIGLTVQRPKVYLSPQLGAISGALDSVYQWLPAALHEHYERAYKDMAGTTGPLANLFSLGGSPETFSGYWIDPRDLFLYGDQFVNYTLQDQVAAVALPTATNQRRYAAEADIDRMFKTSATAKHILHDGVVHLSIAGRQVDRTPGTTL